MNNSDQLLKELETHVQRILEHHNPKQPYAQVLNVTEKRGDLVNALTRYIDERIEERLTRFTAEQGRAQAEQARVQDPRRRPQR